jgi:hypothetical protein
MTNEKRAQLVNQLIEAGGRVVCEDNEDHCIVFLPQKDWEAGAGLIAKDFEYSTFYLLEDGETPESFTRP